MHAFMHACVHACMHAYIHTNIHTYMHTYIYTYIHLVSSGFYVVYELMYHTRAIPLCLHIIDFPQIRCLYAKYIRSESFRKALVYQKRYLLLLLGGYQESEREALAMVARLGTPSSTAMDRKMPQPLTRFRAAVTVVIVHSTGSTNRRA